MVNGRGGRLAELNLLSLAKNTLFWVSSTRLRRKLRNNDDFRSTYYCNITTVPGKRSHFYFATFPLFSSRLHYLSPL